MDLIRLANIDWKLLAKQKQDLVELLNELKLAPSSKPRERIWGIVNMIDQMQDEKEGLA